MMKNIILLLPLAVLLSCNANPATEYSINDEFSYLYMGRDITESDLFEIANDFRIEKNIDIDFSKSTFRKNGRVIQLEIDVDCNDGMKGTLQYSASVLKLSRVGFSRNYTGTGAAFSIGIIGKEVEPIL